MKPTLSEKTPITISLVLILIGGVGWITNVAYKTEANAVTIEKVEKKVDALIEIKEDIAVTKEKVIQIEKLLNRRR